MSNRFRIIKSEKGFSLLEVLVAVALFGIIATAFAIGLLATSQNVILSDNQTTAESLARTIMEDIKEDQFSGTYNDVVLPQEYIDVGYSFTIGIDTVAAGLQKITVTILHNGVEIWSLEGYKSNKP